MESGPNNNNEPNPKRRDRVSTVELYTALEGLLPFAAVEIECLAGYVEDFPDDPDHAQDAERVRQGKSVLELAKRLIARKSSQIHRRQRAFMAQYSHTEI